MIQKKTKMHIIIIVLLVFSMSMSSMKFYGSGQSSREWIPELAINDIRFNTTVEPTDYMEYSLRTHEVVVEVENTGNTVLTGLNLSYEVVDQDSSNIELFGFNISKKKLPVSEMCEYIFYWTPLAEVEYKIEVNISAVSFGKPLALVIYSENYIIHDVRRDVGPEYFGSLIKPAFHNYEFANRSHIITATVKNYGQYAVTTDFSVSAEILYFSNWSSVWSDSITHSGQISPGDSDNITFIKPWLPDRAGDYLINISTALASDDKWINDNITLFFEVSDILDLGIGTINNLRSGNTYPAQPITINAELVNLGNLNVTNTFSAELKISSYPAGTDVFNPSPVVISTTSPENITVPGSTSDILFAPWTYSSGLKPGKYWINISITPFEINGSTTNNNLSIIIELKNVTQISIECISPLSGQYYVEDISNVEVKVSNIGTVDLAPYFLRLSIENQNSAEVWLNYTESDEQPVLQWNDHQVVELLDTWQFGYNAKFKLTISLFESFKPNDPLAICSQTFAIAGGTVNGTITGKVFDVTTGSDGFGVEGIIVSVFTTGSSRYRINSTVTDFFGQYSLEVSGKSWGVTYNISVLSSDNYWWQQTGRDVKVFSGRITMQNLSIKKRPTGNIKGNVQLSSAPGVPEVNTDWSGCMVSVEGTPLSFETDSTGNFEAVVVSGVLNVTIIKENFKSARVEFITLLPDTTTTINVTLEEHWSLRITPSNGDTDVNPDTTILATFNVPINRTTVSFSTFSILDSEDNQLGELLDYDYTFMKSDKTIRLRISNILDYENTYKIKLTKSILTMSGKPALHRNWLSSFETKVGVGSVVGHCMFYWTQLPIKGVRIDVSGLGLQDFSTSTLSDDNGLYSIENIPSGVYSINASLSGYSTQTQNFEVVPDVSLWYNITFSDKLPIPIIWGYDTSNRKTEISDNMTGLLRIDSIFTLTSSIPLDPQTVSSESIQIFEHDTGNQIIFRSIDAANNNLNFIISPEKMLKYDTVYEIFYGQALRTFDDRELFWKTTRYGKFKTEARRALLNINIDPPNNAVNVPIDKLVVLEFPVAINRSSVEGRINASFEITGYNWSNFNMTLILQHDTFQYFTEYGIYLSAGIISESGVYGLAEHLNITFTTITGILTYQFGPFLDSSGDPVSAAAIYIKNGTDTVLKNGMTNDQGYVTFYFESRLPPGNYSIVLNKDNYRTMEWEITIDNSGEPINTDPPIVEREPQSSSGLAFFELVGISAVVIVLIIIFLLLLYLIVFKIEKRPDVSSHDSPLQNLYYKLFNRKTTGQHQITELKTDTAKPESIETRDIPPELTPSTTVKPTPKPTPPTTLKPTPKTTEHGYGKVTAEQMEDKDLKANTSVHGQVAYTPDQNKPSKNELMNKIKNQ